MIEYLGVFLIGVLCSALVEIKYQRGMKEFFEWENDRHFNLWLRELDFRINKRTPPKRG